MASPSILRIERMNYVLAMVATALAAILTKDRAITLGVLVGSGLTCLNFFVLRKLIVRWTADAAAGKPGNAQLLMLPKMMGLIGAVALAVLLLPIDVVAFTVGYSIFIISIVVEAISSTMRGESAATDSEQNHG